MVQGKILNYKKYKEKFSYLVDLEREEEMRQHEKEIKKCSGKEREKKGRALVGMKGKYLGKGLGNSHIVKFTKVSSKYSDIEKRKNVLPETEISVGDLVMLSKNNPLSKRNPTGTVTEKTNYSISIALNELPSRMILKKETRIDLYVNDISYKRMLEALENLDNAKSRKKEIREIFMGNINPAFSKSNNKTNIEIKNLNDSQEKAVRESLKAKDFFLIHGPPGTGKTTTLIEAISKHVEKGKKVLASAPSNIAVDNLVEGLSKKGKKVVRIGHPARVSQNLRKNTLDYLVEDKDDFKKARKLRENASQISEKQKLYPFPSMSYRRGLTNQKIKELAEKNRSARGLSPKIIQKLAKHVKLQDQRTEAIQKAKKLEKKAIKNVVKDAEVICSTNTGAGGDFLEEEFFDLIAIDEATQSTEPSCLIPITKLSEKGKVVMSGDHKQLPPTIISQKSSNEGLDKTLFQRLIDLYEKENTNIKSILETQYRMNRKIMDFPNREFYKKRLKAADSVADHKITLPKKNSFSKNPYGEIKIPTAASCEVFLSVQLTVPPIRVNSGVLNSVEPIKKCLNPENIVCFIDTSRKKECSETTLAETYSKKNNGEAEIVKNIVQEFLKSGIKPEQIGVISPYEAQINILKSLVNKEINKILDYKKTNSLEIKTVDGFQGREKDIIILSFVRSNKSGNIGFLSDLRRLNVSITRARKKLIIIGNSETLKHNDTYKRLIEYIQDLEN